MNKVTITTIDNENREVSMKTIDQIDQKKLVVTQANAMAKSIQKMTLQEKRLLWLAISHIRISDEDFLLYRVPIVRLKEYMGLEGRSVYEDIEKAATNLLTRLVKIEDGKRGWDAFQWVSYCRYRTKEGSETGEAYLEIRMHDTLKPFLLHLKSHFTKFHLLEVSSMPSFNSTRIFEILYSSGMYSKTEGKFKKPKFSFRVTDLKKRLELEGKYRDFKDFRREVLVRAQRDCENYSPLVFTWTEETKGRKIVTLHFTVKRNPKFKDESLPLLDQEEAQVQLVNTEFETAPVSAPKPAQSSFKKPAPAPTQKKPTSKETLKPVSELVSNVVTGESEAKELIFDYALASLSPDERKQAIAAISSLKEPDKQMVLDELNVAIFQGKAKNRWQYLGGLVRAYHRGEFMPTSDLAKKRHEEMRRNQAKRCPYCNDEGMISLRIRDGAVLPKPCNHNEPEIIDYVISREYNIEGAKSSNNRFEQIKEEFETTRHKKVIEIWQGWDDETKRAEAAKFFKTADSYTRRLFNEKGLGHPATLAHFTLYLVKNNHLPPEFHRLKDWYEVHKQ